MKKRITSISLGNWFIITLVTLSVILIATEYFLNHRYSKIIHNAFIDKTQKLITNNMSTTLLFPLATKDIAIIKTIVDRQLLIDEVYAIEVHDSNGTLLYEGKDPNKKQQDVTLKKSIKIIDNNIPIAFLAIQKKQYVNPLLGTVTLHLTTSEITKNYEEVLINRTLAFIAVLGIIILLLLILASHSHKYIKTLLTTMNLVKKGHFNTKHPKSIISEFNDIAIGLDHMSSDLGKVIYDLQSAKNTAEEADKFKSQFIKILSCELRKPVGAVTSMLEQVREKLENTNSVHPVLKNHLNICTSASKELRNIVDELLDFRDMQENHTKPALFIFDLQEMFNQIFLYYQPFFHQKNVSFSIYRKTTNDNTLSDVIISDEHKICRIIKNLIDNALKYSEKGHVNVEWQLNSNNKQINLLATVQDTGVGIADDKLPQIFNDFYQISDNPTAKQSGWGLGLAVVNKLLSVMNGTIAADSKEGIGSKFTISIPVDISKNTTIKTGLEDSTEINILVVDNDGHLFQNLLEKHNISIIVRTDVIEALDVINTINFDIIFIGNSMSMPNGSKFAHKVREISINKNTTIIDIKSNDKEISNTYSDSVLYKPFSISEIYTIIHNVIESKKVITKAIDNIKTAN